MLPAILLCYAVKWRAEQQQQRAPAPKYNLLSRHPAYVPFNRQATTSILVRRKPLRATPGNALRFGCCTLVRNWAATMASESKVSGNATPFPYRPTWGLRKAARESTLANGCVPGCSLLLLTHVASLQACWLHSTTPRSA